MPFTAYLEYLPSLKDCITPVVLGALYWLLRKSGAPAIRSLVGLLRWMRVRELRKAKRVRVDPIATQREVAKEAALFGAFILAAVLSISILIASSPGRPIALQVVSLLFCLFPVIILEIWWLFQKEFINVLIEESARITPKFRRLINPRAQTEHKVQARKKRQERIALQRKVKPKPKLMARGK